MTLPAKPVLFLAVPALCAGIFVATEAHAGGGSGWGWAKPMNKRMGAFYTSNRNANFSRQSHKASSSYYRSQPRHATYPTHRVEKSYAPTIIGVPHVVNSSPSVYTPHRPVTPRLNISQPKQILPVPVPNQVITPSKPPAIKVPLQPKLSRNRPPICFRTGRRPARFGNEASEKSRRENCTTI